MKKTILLAAVALTMILGSCSKEKCVTPNENPQNSDGFNYNFKFSKEIKIYDKTKTHFLTIELKSDNEQVVNEAAEGYNDVELTLLWNKPAGVYNKNKSVESKPQAIPLDDKNTLHIKFVNPNIGNAAGYKISFGANANSMKTFFSGTGNTNLYITCSVAQVFCINGGFDHVVSYWWTGSAWLYETQSGYIYPNGSAYAGTYNGYHWVQVQRIGIIHYSGDISVYI